MPTKERPFPADEGYRMPAEWEPHEATWLAWPHNPKTWPGKLALIPGVYARIVAALAPHEKVRILVPNAAVRESAEATLREYDAHHKNVEFWDVPTNDSWMRDAAPIFVTRRKGDGEAEIAATGWEFNSWGGKYPPYDLDNQIPHHIARRLNMALWEPGIVLEGGSIDTNGNGCLLTTEQCLLNRNRNPHLRREDIEKYLREFLGVEKVLWLAEGIEGDDTDGHIDDLTRFVNPNTIVTVVEDNPADDNYDILQRNLGALRRMTDQDGLPFQVVTLPMPEAVVYEGQRLPASYANFYVANGVVLVPTFECAADARALNVMQELFPHRDVVGIDCRDLVWGLGAIHCITQQQPKADKVAPPRGMM